jgi:hypothetical protein
LLFLIGILALASIGWLVFLTLPFSASSDSDWAAYAASAYGENTTTLTLVAPDSFERILLVQQEDDHLRSAELTDAVSSIVSWYSSRDFIIDSNPDLKSLGVLTSVTEDRFRMPDDGIGEVLDSCGYTAIARIVENNMGEPVLEIVTRSNQHWSMTLDRDLEGVELWVPDGGLLPDQGMSGATIDFSISRGDIHSSEVSWGPQNSSEPTAWTPTPEPDFGPSWTRASFPRPVPSTHLSLEQWRMQAFPPPTSPVAPRPMWPAIRMSA